MKKSIWMAAVVTLGTILTLVQTASAAIATGGDATNDVGAYRIHTFTNSGTFSVTVGVNADVLVVAGGGGGGQVRGHGLCHQWRSQWRRRKWFSLNDRLGPTAHPWHDFFIPVMGHEESSVYGNFQKESNTL